MQPTVQHKAELIFPSLMTLIVALRSDFQLCEATLHMGQCYCVMESGFELLFIVFSLTLFMAFSQHHQLPCSAFRPMRPVYCLIQSHLFH
jgi:hypothetical protein